VNSRILHGDCVEVMRTLEPCSIDACVTDPPYELGFMGKHWDKSGIAFQPEMWREVLRVLKPGAHLLAFGGTRTFHRIGVAIEDAGFEIRDSVAWLHGQGFPKSLDIGKAFDGVLGTQGTGFSAAGHDGRAAELKQDKSKRSDYGYRYEPSSEASIKWRGWGTALKPAFEPVIMARKPFKGSVAGNVQTHGTGALNIDACRVQFASEDDKEAAAAAAAQRTSHNGLQGTSTFARTGDVQESIDGYVERMDLGRWPANVCLDDLAALVLDEQSGELVSNSGEPFTRNTDKHRGVYGALKGTEQEQGYYGDSGGASRFFYVAKPSREERDYGIWHDNTKSGGDATNRTDGSAGLNSPRAGAGRTGGSRNFHPTVKPVELMRWLVRLVTPIDGTVLDPFLGSGTTGMACRYELRNFIGIEREREYIDIAERRIGNVAPLFATPADPEAGTDTQGEK
jgi:DNA modification methylase